MRHESKCCIHIPERFIYKNRIVDTAFTPYYHCFCIANKIICMTHDTATTIYRIFAIFVLYLTLISSISNIQNIRESHAATSKSSKDFDLSVSFLN